jgi:lambda family phage tail tape measure protein
MALRDEAKIGGDTFKQLTADVKKLDAQLAKTSKRSGNVGARQATQIAGAVVSGGIFGGPEGAIGALGGAALGGVEGAFAGAAIGAQLKGLRDLTASAANYAADIEKLQIALKGVAGPQADYNSAIQAAQDVTNRFNVPQRDAIRGVTRLAAAVKGAKGPIEDAETTFKNITAAIKATGGSTEDVRGAITAMVQVFSKGKVSAEELSGQLGERLPGAVTKFAEANDMTLPELQKNLKAGTVGLNELMNFIRELGDTYGETAEQIADSNAEAGARLTVVIQNMQADIGKALVPIGAQFQAAFADFITNITPFLVDFVPKIAKGFLTLAKNLDTVLVAATAAFAVFAPVKLAAMIANVGGVSAAVELLKGKLVALGLANPFTALGIAAAGLAGFIHNAAKEQARFNDLLKKGSVAEIDADLLKERAALDKALTKQLQADQAPKALYGFEFGGIDVAAADAEVKLIQDRIEKLEQRRSAIFDIDPGQGAALDSYNFSRFQYEKITSDGSGTASTIKDITDAEAKAQIESIRNRTRGIELTKEAIAKEAELARVAAEKLPPNRKSVELARIAQKEAGQLNKLQQDELKIANNIAKAKLDLSELLAKAKGEQGLLNEEQVQQELNQIKVNELMLKYNLLVEEGVIKQEDLRKKLEEAVAALNKAKSPLESFRSGLQKVFQEAMNLNQALAERGVQAVQQFGDAFADFVATGKSSFAELTQSILQDLSRIFARAALFQGLSLIPGIGGFLGLGGGGGGGSTGLNVEGIAAYMNAKGNIYAKNKIVPFAYGGIVKKPTLFPMANGAGLMGEAGPEAIMPLRRGRDGKLGVEASGGVGNVVVNVDASGSRVQGDQPNAKALGSAIGAAVQAEIVRQKRPAVGE